MQRISRIEKGNDSYGCETCGFSYDTAGRIKQLTHGEKKFIFHHLSEKILIEQEGKEEQVVLEFSDGRGVKIVFPGEQAILEYKNQRLANIIHGREQPVLESFQYTDTGQLQTYNWQKENQQIEKTFIYNQKKEHPAWSAMLNWLVDFESEWTFLFMDSTPQPMILPDIISTSMLIDGEEINRSEIRLDYKYEENSMEVVLRKKEEIYGYIRFFCT